MSNLKITCPAKDDYDKHPKNCSLCKNKLYTVIPASFTEEPITEVITFTYDSMGKLSHKVTKNGFGSIICTKYVGDIKND